jgi:hypothetical protein
MKKLLVLVPLFVICFSAYSQVTIGAKTGLNIANVSGDGSEELNRRVSMHIGGYFNFAFSERLSLQPELLYSAVGFSGTESGTNITGKLDYISVPVTLSYSFGEFSIHAGPQFGMLTSAKWEIENREVDVKHFYKGTDIGFALGVGLNLGKFDGTARYVAGFSNIWDASEDISLRNNLIQLSLGYKIFSTEN